MSNIPSLFISHGSPLTIITEDEYAERLRTLGRSLKNVKAAIVMSAHGLSEEGKIKITSSPQPKLIYDFGGFPEELYRIQYPCPGSPEIAKEIGTRFEKCGFQVELDSNSGIDHGVWVPLARMFPQANIPVVQISMPYPSKPQRVFQMGEVLKDLREQGVLLIGSGGAVHNLSALNWHKHKPSADSWALDFNNWLKDCVRKKKFEDVFQFERLAPHSKKAHPTTEHFFPILFTLGTAMNDDRSSTIIDEFQYESLSMYSFKFVES